VFSANTTSYWFSDRASNRFWQIFRRPVITTKNAGSFGAIFPLPLRFFPLLFPPNLRLSLYLMEAKRAKTNDMALAKKTIDTIRVLVRRYKLLCLFVIFLSLISVAFFSLFPPLVVLPRPSFHALQLSCSPHSRMHSKSDSPLFLLIST
jgi:hypothetical protein